jgi:hypothetical protein
LPLSVRWKEFHCRPQKAATLRAVRVRLRPDKRRSTAVDLWERPEMGRVDHRLKIYVIDQQLCHLIRVESLYSFEKRVNPGL